MLPLIKKEKKPFVIDLSTRCANGLTGLVAYELLSKQEISYFFSQVFVYPFPLFLSYKESSGHLLKRLQTHHAIFCVQ